MPSHLIRVTYVKSAIGYTERQKRTVRSLGLRRIGDVVIHEENPAVLGMVRAVRHLVSAEPVAEAEVVGRDAEGSDTKTKTRGTRP